MARIKASQDLQGERVQQVKYGSAMEENLIESLEAPFRAVGHCPL
jgi:hypothetical protein